MLTVEVRDAVLDGRLLDVSWWPDRTQGSKHQSIWSVNLRHYGCGLGTASNYRQPIARSAFQAAVPVSQVLS